MWKPSVTNVKLKKGSNKLLTIALRKVVKRGHYVVGNLRDFKGVYAFLLNNDFILVAKEKPYGDLVSVHKSVYDFSVAHNHKILLYLKSNDKFYVFNPDDLKGGWQNLRGRVEMWNFKLNLGTRWDCVSDRKK